MAGEWTLRGRPITPTIAAHRTKGRMKADLDAKGRGKPEQNDLDAKGPEKRETILAPMFKRRGFEPILYIHGHYP